MKFAISMYCSRLEQPGNPDGYIPGSLSIVHEPGVVEAASVYEANGIGLAIVYKLFPPKDRWQNHNAKACPIANVLRVEDARLREPQ